jgi:elongation factor Ts
VGKFYQDSCLLEQPYVKDPNQTVTDYLSAVMAKTGENIRVRRFVRFALGESLSSDASQSAPAAAEQA